VKNATGRIQIAIAYSSALIALRKIMRFEQEREAKSPQAVTRVSNPSPAKALFRAAAKIQPHAGQ